MKAWLDKTDSGGPHPDSTEYVNSAEINSVGNELNNLVLKVGQSLTEGDDDQVSKSLVMKINSMADVQNLGDLDDGDAVAIRGWHPGSIVGGGEFYYDSSIPKSSHDGGRYLSPTVPWTVVTADFLDGVGETDPGGTGCLVSIDPWVSVLVEKYGGTGQVSWEKLRASTAKILCALSTVTLDTNSTLISGQHVFRVAFTGPGDLNVPTDSQIVECTFAQGNLNLPYNSQSAYVAHNRFINGAFIDAQAGFGTGPRDVTIYKNKTTASPLLFATTINESLIYDNDVDGEGYGFSISFAGARNRILANKVKNSVTGIVCIPTRSANQQVDCSDNVIRFNYALDTTEESITLDARANSSLDGLAVGSTDIATSVGANVMFTDAMPVAYQQINQYVVFQTGPRKGEYYKILTAGGSGLGPYQLDGFTSRSDDPAQTVTIQCGAFNNIVADNIVANRQMMVWGSWVGTKVLNNRSTNGNIRLNSICGIASEIPGGLSQQPTHNVHVENNVVREGDVWVTKNEFSGATQIEPVGLRVINNDVDDTHFTDIELGDYPDVAGNKNLTCDIPSRRTENGVTYVTIPKITVTNNTREVLYTHGLPAQFGVCASVKTTVSLAQCVGVQNDTSIGWRSNEATSSYNSADTAGTLNKLCAVPGNRDITSITTDSVLTSTTAFNDTAEMEIGLTVVIAGGLTNPSTTARCAVELTFRDVG